jgi:hypothetical protein
VRGSDEAVKRSTFAELLLGALALCAALTLLAQTPATPTPRPCDPHDVNDIQQLLIENIIATVHRIADKYPSLMLTLAIAVPVALLFGALWVLRAFLKGAYEARLKLGTAPLIVSGLISSLSFLDRAYQLGVFLARKLPWGDSVADILEAKRSGVFQAPEPQKPGGGA